MILKNESDKIIYYSAYTNKVVDELEALNQSLSFNLQDYRNFLSNGLNTLRRPGKYKYFSGLASIPPRTAIKIDKESFTIFENLSQQKSNFQFDKVNLLKEIEFLLKDFEGKQLGVELSGGLDSSLVIEGLLKFKIEPILIGFSSDRFEFRTERIIQKYYQNKVSKSILLKYEDNFAFSNLKETPVHPLPVSESHFFQRHKTVALTAKKMGVDILLSGEAGDQILSYPVDLKENETIPIDFGYWCLAEHWSNQYVYEKIGIQYVSGLALGAIPSIILSLRNEHKWDPMKLWARSFFTNCLPRELSNFAYTAFHNGWVSEGLIHASETISDISEKVYSKYKIEELKPERMMHVATIYSTLNENDRKRYLANLAFSTWYYSLTNN